MEDINLIKCNPDIESNPIKAFPIPLVLRQQKPLLCSTTSIYCSIKPLMLFRLLGARFENINKDNIAILWCANKKVRIKSVVFIEWFRNWVVLEFENVFKKKYFVFETFLVL